MSSVPIRHAPLIAPSLLGADHGCFQESAQEVASLGLTWLHLDIMDGHFVPNISFGSGVLAALRPHSKLFFDTHLMLQRPHDHIEAFAKAGADLITIHVESDSPIQETLDRIHALGCQRGLSLNPDTPEESLLPYLGSVDLVLVMTVQPGFGGQAFREDVLPKLERIHAIRQKNGYSFRLEVDGGIDAQTAHACARAGADVFVTGTAFFKSKNKPAFIDAFSLGA